jgi:signal transduction histidine kinase
LKYADAGNVSVTIEIGEVLCSLSIEDDGIGFDTSKRTNGIGLKNIESRCSLFNGTMDIVTAPGKGCTLKIQLPVDNEGHKDTKTQFIANTSEK